jgi:hypothetical protein
VGRRSPAAQGEGARRGFLAIGPELRLEEIRQVSRWVAVPEPAAVGDATEACRVRPRRLDRRPRVIAQVSSADVGRRSDAPSVNVGGGRALNAGGACSRRNRSSLSPGQPDHSCRTTRGRSVPVRGIERITRLVAVALFVQILSGFGSEPSRSSSVPSGGLRASARAPTLFAPFAFNLVAEVGAVAAVSRFSISAFSSSGLPEPSARPISSRFAQSLVPRLLHALDEHLFELRFRPTVPGNGLDVPRVASSHTCGSGGRG